MAGAGEKPSRIRDVVRDSKILRDSFANFDQKFDGFGMGTDRDYYQQAVRAFPRTQFGEISECYEGRPMSSKSEYFWTTEYFSMEKSLFDQQRCQDFESKVKLLTFDGSCLTVDFLDWIDTLEDYFEAVNLSDIVKCRLAASKLKGEARKWWKELQNHRIFEGKNSITSWPRMSKLLIKKFLHTSRLTYFHKQENEDDLTHAKCSMKVPFEAYGNKEDRENDPRPCGIFGLNVEENDFETSKKSAPVTNIMEESEPEFLLSNKKQCVEAVALTCPNSENIKVEKRPIDNLIEAELTELEGQTDIMLGLVKIGVFEDPKGGVEHEATNVTKALNIGSEVRDVSTVLKVVTNDFQLGNAFSSIKEVVKVGPNEVDFLVDEMIKLSFDPGGDSPSPTFEPLQHLVFNYGKYLGPTTFVGSCMLDLFRNKKQEAIGDSGILDESGIIHGNSGIETLMKSGLPKPTNDGMIGQRVTEMQPSFVATCVFMKEIAVMDQKARTKQEFDGKHSLNSSRTGEESGCATKVDNAEDENYQRNSYLEVKQIDSLVGKTLMLNFDPGGAKNHDPFGERMQALFANGWGCVERFYVSVVSELKFMNGEHVSLIFDPGGKCQQQARKASDEQEQSEALQASPFLATDPYAKLVHLMDLECRIIISYVDDAGLFKGRWEKWNDISLVILYPCFSNLRIRSMDGDKTSILALSPRDKDEKKILVLVVVAWLLLLHESDCPIGGTTLMNFDPGGIGGTNKRRHYNLEQLRLQACLINENAVQQKRKKHLEVSCDVPVDHGLHIVSLFPTYIMCIMLVYTFLIIAQPACYHIEECFSLRTCAGDEGSNRTKAKSVYPKSNKFLAKTKCGSLVIIFIHCMDSHIGFASFQTQVDQYMFGNTPMELLGSCCENFKKLVFGEASNILVEDGLQTFNLVEDGLRIFNLVEEGLQTLNLGHLFHILISFDPGGFACSSKTGDSDLCAHVLIKLQTKTSELWLAFHDDGFVGVSDHTNIGALRVFGNAKDIYKAKLLVCLFVTPFCEVGVVDNLNAMTDDSSSLAAVGCNACELIKLLAIHGNRVWMIGILRIGWNDENGVNTERKLVMVKNSVAIIDLCVNIFCDNGYFKKTLRLFFKLVNGLDPPNVYPVFLLASWQLKHRMTQQQKKNNSRTSLLFWGEMEMM